MSTTTGTTTDSKPRAARRTRKQQSDVVLDALVRMPLGELAALATKLATRDQETARFLQARITAALNDGAAQKVGGQSS